MFSKSKPEGFVEKMRVVGMIISVGDEVLLCKRAFDKKKGAGQWSLMSGKCEPGEVASDAVKREAKEEFGITIEEARLRHSATYYCYPEEDKEYTLIWDLYIYSPLEKPDIVLNDEHSKYVWVSKTDIEKYDLIEGALQCLNEFYQLNK